MAEAKARSMAKSARRYDFYLPLADNDGRLIPAATFDAVERQFFARFGGITSQQPEFPLRGAWKEGEQIYLDQIVVVTVLDFRPRGSARFIAELKQDLLHDFKQLEILITEQALRVH